jgi:hypothetical protein
MLAQLCGAHGLAARVEGAEALSTANIFRLETAGVAMVCLSYLDSENMAAMRYAVRRLRRKLPRAKILIGHWTSPDDPAALETLREGAKADLIAATLRDATQLCIQAAQPVDDQRAPALDLGTQNAAIAG